MSKKKPFLRTNDHYLIQALEKLTGVRMNGTLKEYLECLDEVVELPLRVPFQFSHMIVVYERVNLIHEIFNPKPTSFLLDVLADAPRAPFLISDPGFTSADSLFVVTQTEIEDSLVSDWMSSMRHAKVLLNEHPRFGGLFAAALTSFQYV
jgi:hypothetical protein